MNNHPTVDVFLGSEQDDDTERQFLSRLERDLAMRGVRALVMANLAPPPKYLQTDFVIVTEHRTVICELKAANAPLAGGANGPWKRSQGGVETRLPVNPYRQAQAQAYGLSDAMRRFAQSHDAPPASRGGSQYFRDVKTVVCVYPEIPAGSQLDRYPFVEAVGYRQLIDSLTSRGPSVPWDRGVFESFVRWLGLYRQEDDLPEARAKAADTRIVDEYRGRFLAGRPEAHGLVATRVSVDGVPGERPDLNDLARSGTSVVLTGASGLGKSVWLRQTARRLAEAGDVPVWIEAAHADSSLRTSLARSVAGLTTVSAPDLLRAAQAAGRQVVFFVDGLDEADEAVKAAVLDGVTGMVLRGAGRTVVVAAQEPVDLPDATTVVLGLPDEQERLEILQVVGGDLRLAEVGAFRTPLDLVVAAECAEPDAGPAETASRNSVGWSSVPLRRWIRCRTGDQTNDTSQGRSVWRDRGVAEDWRGHATYEPDWAPKAA